MAGIAGVAGDAVPDQRSAVGVRFGALCAETFARLRWNLQCEYFVSNLPDGECQTMPASDESTAISFLMKCPSDKGNDRD